jgi:hypothetical protein
MTVALGLVAATWEELARDSIARLTIGGKRWKTASRWWGKAGKGREMEIDVAAESLPASIALTINVLAVGDAQDED